MLPLVTVTAAIRNRSERWLPPITLGRSARIGKLLKLGFETSERTVSRLMPKRHKEPKLEDDFSE
jgi:hypothetical protein